ncbi:hypothetical protein PROFUN_03667 [Planoprotostelium fungivorum]|uniref:Kinesin motor domain-containing protein n=1 Tax=Planoprotostelium fungivorum TaxID=1890364 RepID=A0A2P6NSH2_9EUKA|nr:hypothetical protein PROFUN_03667 [Planoprotostelium fungivorum]
MANNQQTVHSDYSLSEPPAHMNADRKPRTQALLDSWKVFEALFYRKSSQDAENNLALLLEAWTLSDGGKLSQNGYIVLDTEKEGGKIIFHLDDFRIGYKYISEKGNTIERRGDVLHISTVITIPIPERNYSRANGDPNFSGSFDAAMAKINAGIVMLNSREKTNELIFDLDDLMYNIMYRCNYFDGYCRLCRKNNEWIDMVFYHSSPSTIFSTFGTQNTLALSNGVVTDDIMIRRQRPKKFFNWKRRNVNDALQGALQSDTDIDMHNLSTPPPVPSRMKRIRDESSDCGILASPEKKIKDVRSLDKENANPQVNLIEFEESVEMTDFAPAPPPPPSAPAPPPPPSQKTMKGTKSPRKKMKTLQWTPLADHKLKETIWNKLNDGSNASPVFDNKELTTLFSVAPKLSVSKSMSNTPVSKSVSLLDIKRSNNIGILLSRMLRMPAEEMCNSIVNMDNHLSLDQLLTIQSILPTERELQVLRKYRGDVSLLGVAEKFLIRLGQVDRLELRVEYFVFKLRLSEDLQAITENIRCVAMAAEQLIDSSKFGQLLKIILELGAVLNEGTYLKSHGFKLDSLLKLSDTKSKNSRVNLLHYLATIIYDKVPILMDVQSDIPDVETASEISMDVMSKELNEINLTMTRLQQELEKFADIQDPFYVIMTEFHKKMKPVVDESTKMIKTTMEQVSKCASYFGEEGTDEKNCRTLFHTVHKFCQSLQNALGEVEKQKKLIVKTLQETNLVDLPPKDISALRRPASMSKEATNVRVVCRFRPRNRKEIDAGNQEVFSIDEDQMTLHLKATEGIAASKFVFDRVFGTSTTQAQIFDYAAKPVIEDIMRGYNGTIFVYGQTSSGKTHTMQGPSIDDPELKGIIPRMTNTIFDGVQKADSAIEFLVKASYVEIYMEKIRDLLDPNKNSLQVREEKTKGIWVEGATEHYVACEQDVLDVIRVGSQNRAIAATNMNFESSRSHSIFILTVQQRNLNDQSLKSGKLYLVDLAGSEKVEKTGAQGTVLDEAKMINKSLSALGNVINALTDGKSAHVPYRDSKLTRVLQESLGGNSRTTLIINCSPVDFNEAETVSTCRFGTRAKSIKNAAKINQERSMGELKILLARAEKLILEQEIDTLNVAVAALQDEVDAYKRGGLSPVGREQGSGEKSSLPNVAKLQDTVAELEERIRVLEEDKQTMQDQYDTMIDEYKDKEADFEKIDQLRQQTDDVNHQYRTSQKENEILVFKLAEMTISSEKVQYENQELQLTVEKLKAEKENLAQTLTDSEISLKAARDELEAKENKIAENNARFEKRMSIDANIAKRLEETSGAAAEKEVITSLRQELESYKRDMQALRVENEELQKAISGEDNDNKTTDNRVEKELKSLRDREKQKVMEFDTLRSALIKDLENRCQKVVELEICLDEARDQYTTLLGQVKSSNTKALQQKCIFLQKNVEQLTANNQQLQSELGKVRLEFQVAEKQLSVRNDRIQGLEHLLLDTQEKLHKYTSESEEKKVPATVARRPSGSGMSLTGGRIARPLRGGGGNPSEEKGGAQPATTKTGFFQFWKKENGR